jgi:mannose-6-phosphate isomerase-like protein (cupin superfamily)
VETIDKTIQHLKGARQMKTEEIFAGFSVPAGQDRFGETTKLGEQPVDIKVSAKDTDGAMCVFEFTGPGGPKHLHYDQDEWIYVLEGEYLFEVAGKRIRIKQGESIFLPRKVPHAWTSVSGAVGKILNVYQPAGKMEDFFRAIAAYKDKPTLEQVVNKSYTTQQKMDFNTMFEAHGMDLLGGPLLP